MTEILEFEVIKETDGGYAAACYQERIYTEGKNLEELQKNITSAIDTRFVDRPKPTPDQVKLVIYKEESN